jgi:hypothetical protein
MAVRPPKINGSDIRSHKHSLYTVTNGGPQTAVPYIYVRHHSWFPCGRHWHGQQVQNPRDSTIGESPTIIGDVTDITTRIHKSVVCQKNGIQSKRTRNKFQNSVLSGKPQFMGTPQHLGVCSGLIYATDGDNIASENTWYLPRIKGKGLENGMIVSRHRAEYTAKNIRQGFPSNASFKLYVFSLSNRHESTHI